MNRRFAMPRIAIVAGTATGTRTRTAIKTVTIKTT
jgi:hypothetical protein